MSAVIRWCVVYGGLVWAVGCGGDGRLLREVPIEAPARIVASRQLVDASDDGWIVAGSAELAPRQGGLGDDDLLLFRVDAGGRALWTRAIGGAGSDRLWGLDRTADGGVVLVGQTSSYGAGSLDAYLVKTDLEARFPSPPPLAVATG